jgi:aromatic ring-opening dioxygenase catalytic subunit (LigB family)
MEIVGAFACSHAGLIVARRDRAPAAQRDRVFGAYRAVQEEIVRLRPDALVVVATDHLQAFPLTSVPAFAIGVGPIATGLGDAGVPPCTVSVHQGLARAVLDGCMTRGVELAFSEQVAIDHSFVMPLSLLTPRLDVPIVPLAQNCNVPPRPSLQRSRELGQAIRASIQDGPRGRAVVIGTGGLSHWVGSPTRRAFMNRPTGTRIAELAAHPVVLEETGEINQEFDRRFLDQVAAGQLAEFAATWTPERIEEVAGNGAQELRNWFTTAAVVADARATVLAYEPVAEWLTGTAIVRFVL